LSPANATNPGIVTTGAQILAGAKTFNSDLIVNAQVGIGVTTANMAASAQLDVSSTTKGFLPPRMTEAQRNLIVVTSASAGLIVYCKNCGSNGEMQYYNGSSWTNMMGAAAATDLTPQVTIGAQVWATKNLDVSTYSDGTSIPQVTDQTAWANLTTGAWCYYSNTTANGTTYGKLYNWYAVAGIYDASSFSDSSLRKNLAPAGYHIPTDAEWILLTNYLGGMNVAAGKMKEVGTTHWASPNTATNSSGFTALPGGYRTNSFNLFSTNGFWWTSTENTPTLAWGRFMDYSNNIENASPFIKKNGCSVRCLRD
jgi:uncharacterized protein (TIGR02145 family)